LKGKKLSHFGRAGAPQAKQYCPKTALRNGAQLNVGGDDGGDGVPTLPKQKP
jgi:hypothetical protein